MVLRHMQNAYKARLRGYFWWRGIHGKVGAGAAAVSDGHSPRANVRSVQATYSDAKSKQRMHAWEETHGEMHGDGHGVCEATRTRVSLLRSATSHHKLLHDTNELPD